MTSGVPTVITKDHWKRQKDGSYISSHPKYEGMRIEKAHEQRWLLHQSGMNPPVHRHTLQEIKNYAYTEANWVAPSVREYV